MKMSLRIRLLVSTLVIFAVAWILVAYSTEREIHKQALEQFDLQLEQKHRFLQVIVRHEASEQDVVRFASDLKAADLLIYMHGEHYGMSFAIWSPEGEQLLKSRGAPPFELANLDHGYIERLIGGQPWRLLTREDPLTHYSIAIGYHLKDLGNAVDHVTVETLKPLSVIMLALTAVLWYVIGRSMQPLNRLTDEIMARHPLALHTVSMKSVPKEVQPLVAALNLLLKRLEETFNSYDNFTADAAHELRTPLAGLALQVEASLRATSEEDRTHALQMVRRGVDRASHIVEQMLALSRLNTMDGAITDDTADLREPCENAVQSLAALAEERRIAIELRGETHRQVRGDAGLVEVMMTNLVRNAILYTPEGGQVIVELGVENGRPYVAVEDTGPGIPQAKREAVQERFVRLADVRSEGSGLGLAIVRRVVDLHRGDLELADRATGNGLRVTVRFLAA